VKTWLRTFLISSRQFHKKDESIDTLAPAPFLYFWSTDAIKCSAEENDAMRIHILQGDLIYGEDNIRELGREIRNSPADIYVLPELFTSGYAMIPATRILRAESFIRLTNQWSYFPKLIERLEVGKAIHLSLLCLNNQEAIEPVLIADTLKNLEN
jgi:hypothetical protein